MKKQKTLDEWREPNLPKHWRLGGFISGPKGFDYAYRHSGVGCFTIERMGKNVRSVGAKWRIFCNDSLLSETQYSRASQAAAHADDIIQAVVPGVLAYAKITMKVGGHTRER